MLWLLVIAAPLLLWFLNWAWRKRGQLIAKFVQSRLLAQLTVGVSRRRQKLRLGLVGFAALSVLFALARPQYGFAWEHLRTRGLDILVGIDTSRSMLATDVSPNRLARAKLAALDLMRAARTDRLGLIAFAGTAFLQCPLTLDDNAFSDNVNYLNPGILPQAGTALAAAIDTAVHAFKNSDDNFKVLILMTDGEDHEEGVIEAAERAAKEGIRIFTVGVGTPEGERIKVEENGKTSYVKDEDGNVVVSKLNANLLQQIAAAAQGDYLPLQGADTMNILYQNRIAPLPRRDLDARIFRQYHERYQWPLALAILCLVAEMFIHERQRVERTSAIIHSGNVGLKKLVGPAIAILGLGWWPSSALADDAFKAYQSGKFKEAQREYQRLLQRNPKDPRLRFNAGTAAYRAGDLEQATNQLGAATFSSDPNLLQRSYYNLGNAQYRMGEQADDPASTAANWKKAISHYESALKLNPQDQDAKFNRDFVAKKLEELQKQMQQQQKDSDQKKQDSQQSQSDQSQQSQQQDQQSDQQRQQQQQDNKDQSPQQESQSRQPQPQPSDQDQQQTPQPSPDQKQEQTNGRPEDIQTNPAGKQDKSPGDDKGESQPMTPPGQMTPEQARQLLEAARAEERAWILVPPDTKRRTRTYREW